MSLAYLVRVVTDLRTRVDALPSFGNLRARGGRGFARRPCRAS